MGNYSRNINRALLLADKSAYHYYADFAEKGYYTTDAGAQIVSDVGRGLIRGAS